MSGYFDALERAARGGAGLAVPRPRARFEDSDEWGGSNAELEATEPEPERAAPIAPPSPPQAQSPVVPATAASQALPALAAVALPHMADAAAAPLAAAPGIAQPVEAPAFPVPPPGAVTALPERHVEHQTRVEIIPNAAMPTAIERDAVVPPAAAAMPPADSPAQDADQPTGARADPVSLSPVEVVLTAAAVAAPPPPPAPAPVDAPPPPLVIAIDRIDIRITADVAAPAASPRRRAAPVETLADYLARRSGTPA